MNAAAVTTPREIDFSKPFFPTELTALVHAPSWALLSDAHRLRYSQLYALYSNEQTAFFEELLASSFLPALYRRPERLGDDLALGLRQFEKDEREHSRWFRKLNHRVDPQRFGLEAGRYVFIPVTDRSRAVMAWFARRPFSFPCWIWLVLLQEERSIAVSRECLSQGLGLEPNFLTVHRKHLADEVNHVQWDLQLVERVWIPMPRWKRRLQARVFGTMMREFFTAPKRSAKMVLQNLIDEFDDLAPLAAQLHAELMALSDSRDYHASLYSRSRTPRCFELFDQLPEFHDIARALPAYQRP